MSVGQANGIHASLHQASVIVLDMDQTLDLYVIQLLDGTLCADQKRPMPIFRRSRIWASTSRHSLSKTCMSCTKESRMS